MNTRSIRRLLPLLPILAVPQLTPSTAESPQRPSASANERPGPTMPKRRHQSALECEQREFACSWSDVERSALRRAAELFMRAELQYARSHDLDTLAVWLEQQADVEWIEHDAGELRFLVRGARPLGFMLPPEAPRLLESSRRGEVFGDTAAWALPPAEVANLPEGDDAMPLDVAEFTSGRVEATRQAARVGVPIESRSEPGMSGAQADDQVVGNNADLSRKPTKKALVLQLMDWQFGPTDERKLVHTLEDSRSYGCEGCITHFVNDYQRARPGDSACLAEADGSCVPTIVTDWRVFTGWEQYDLIHVSTHGVQRCSTPSALGCTTLLYTGRTVTLPHPALDRNAYLDALVRALESLTHIGVELRQTDPYVACPERRAQDTLPLPGYVPPIAPGTVAFEQLCLGGLRYEVVTEDFFRAEYPEGLEDKIIFLNACETFAHPGLVRHLARTGNTTVLGWHSSVKNDVAGEVARAFYDELLGPDLRTAVSTRGRDATARRGGLRVDSAWHRAVTASDGQGLKSVPVFRSDGSIKNSTGRAATSRNDGKRAREIVFLVDDGDDLEVQDHATLSLIGVPGDGVRDSIDVVVDVSGFVAGDPSDAYRVRFRMDGTDLPVTVGLPAQVSEDVRRFRGTIPLGFDVALGQRVDLDVRVDIPGGGISHWLYEDLLLMSRCSFYGRVTEIRIANPRERLLATLGSYQGRAVMERNGNLRLTIVHDGNPRTDHGAPGDVTEFSLGLQFPAALDPDETGRRPLGRIQLPAGVLSVRRPNPHHNPNRPQNSQDPMAAVFDSPIMRPSMFPTMELSSFTATRMAGTLRAPFESPQAKVLFEGVFDAGTARRCGVPR